MMSAITITRPSLAALAACTAAISGRAAGLAPVGGGRSVGRDAVKNRRPPPRTWTSALMPSSCGGPLAYSVNDYFASFDGEGGDEKSPERVPYDSVNDYFAAFNGIDRSGGRESGSSYHGGKSQKYIGHGRIGGGGDEGGVFNINNYFASFTVPNDDDGDDVIDVSEMDDGAEVSVADLLSFHISSQPSASASRHAGKNRNDDVGGRHPSSDMSFDEIVAFTNAQFEDHHRQHEESAREQRPTYEEIVAHNNARLCPKMLLTQCAIQSFMCLSEECRDPHSGKWIEDFLGLQNLGNYHGTGAINVTKFPTWDSVLYDMMQQPNEKMIVSAKRRGRGHGGWSKNNPYLRERWVEFKIDIRPATLVQRLLPIREQIARELEIELDIVFMTDANSISADMLAKSTDPGGSPSPLRGGNLDLLYSLCTQASAHRLLRELQSTSEHDATYQWFKRFYAEHASEYFDGDQNFGRGDDFVDALVGAPPSLVMATDGTPVGWADPPRIAERIVSMRREVAREWKEMMREVANDHLEMNHVLWRVIAGRTMDESGNDVIEIREDATVEELSDSTGAFE